MTAAWIFFGLMIGTLVASAVNATTEIARLRGYPTRWLWTAGIALTIGLFLVAPTRRLPERAPAPVTDPGAPAGLTPDWEVVRTEPASWKPSLDLAGRVEGVMSVFARLTPPWLEALLQGTWAIASIGILLLVLATQIRFWRRRRAWPRADIQGVSVRISPQTGPAVMGVARPEIVVPRWVLQLDPSESAMVLAHEEEHVRAKDPILLLAAWLGIAILPWHPAVWWMAGRLRLAVETDCDRRVLRRGMNAREYGALLIELSQRSSGFGVGMAALAGHPSQLERRLIAMTSTRARHVAARALPMGLLATLAVLVACEAKLPTAAEVAQMDVADAEAALDQSASMVLADGKTTYFVDGVEVSAEEARRLAPEKIAAMELSHSDEPTGMSRIITVRSKTAEDAAKVNARDAVASGKIGDAVLFIDGTRSEAAALAAIGAANLRSIEVIKDRDEAVRKWGPGAENGVIVATTKVRSSETGEGRNTNSGRAVLGGGALTLAEVDEVLTREQASPTIYVIDGVRSDRAGLEAIKPGEIWSAMYKKDPTLTELYGAEGANGMLTVLTKTGSADQYQRFRTP